MGPRHLLLVAAIAALTSLGGATVTLAHALVDPATQTPPLKPFRGCYEDGPWVKFDTRDSAAEGTPFSITAGPTSLQQAFAAGLLPVESYANQEVTDLSLPCGTPTRARW
jgi:hypothetical protein